jgi:hypothetical protein
MLTNILLQICTISFSRSNNYNLNICKYIYKCKGKVDHVSKHHAMKMYKSVDVNFHAVLTSVLDAFYKERKRSPLNN